MNDEMSDEDFYDSMRAAAHHHYGAFMLLGYMWACGDLGVNHTEHWWKAEVATLLWAMSLDGCFDGVEK